MTDLTQRIRAMQAKHKQELAPLRKQLAAERKRERESRPKVVKGKARTAEEREYDGLLKRLDWKRCWACGRTAKDWPFWWGGDRFGMVRAHVVNQTRVERPEVVVCLCDSCHFLNHNQSLAGSGMPPLTKAHLLWLRIQHGADMAVLTRHSIGALPKAEPLPAAYVASLLTFSGESA